MTTTDALALDIEILSPEEAADIWKRASRRAPNFSEYVDFLQSRKVGDTFRLKVPHGTKNAEHAKEIRYNFNEAAKERKVDGKPAPFVLRWKANTRTEQKTVEENGKTGKVDVTVIDLLTALIVDPATVTHREKRPPTEVVDPIALGVPTLADDAKTIVLPDGRTAKKTKAGKWRATKIAPVAPAATAPTDDAKPTDTPAATTPATAPADDAKNGTKPAKTAPVAA